MSVPSNASPGHPSPPEDGGDALPVGTRLAEFAVREVLGAGGFGIVYRAWDDALQRDVALKEYMPVSLAGRGAGERVTLRSRGNEDDFALGLQSFVNEARLLARFDHPALVKVFRFWEGNGTAYMAMPLYKGRNLRQLRKAGGTFDDAWVRALVGPLLGALETMHAAEVYHRDIAPDNILWCDDQRPVLLDFGAARLVLADRTQNLTAILKPQFAPIEQYAETQSMRQGPWTDLYALAGTVYFMLTGRAPLPATARTMSDELPPLAQAAPAGCSLQLLQALDWAMAVRPQDRPQSVAEFRDALEGRIDVPARAEAPVRAGSAAAVASPSSYEKTVLATTVAAPRPQAPAASAARHEALESPDRSVMLPPKSQSPLKALLLLLVLAAAGAGAWTTRTQWMPAVGLQAAAPVAVAASAPPANSPASTAASAPLAIAEAASAAASEATPAASEVAPAVAEAASEPASAAALPPSPPKPSKAARDRSDKALAARLAALPLPPPVLPPLNEAQVGTPAPAASGIETPAAAAARIPGWREVCADQEPAKIAACVKRLCDNDARYQRYPVCQRMRRLEGRPGGGQE